MLRHPSQIRSAAHTATEHSTVSDEGILIVCIVTAIIPAYAAVTLKKRIDRS
jgi:hypothetical protein